MFTNKLHPGSPFPTILVFDEDGETVDLAEKQAGSNWKMVVVYRGKHCPLCTKYLNELEQYVADLGKIGVDIIAVSGDSQSQLREHLAQLSVSFPFACGLTEEQMKTLGLYISLPRSANETNHNFSEPGLFMINEEGNIQVVDISNNPFCRPQIEALVSGLKWIKDPANNYPIRGTLR